MSSGAYLLAKFTDSDKLLPAIEGVRTVDQVRQWDAVEGHYNLVIKLNGGGQKVDWLQLLDGVEELKICELKDGGKEDQVDPEHSRSYVFVDVEESRGDAVQKLISEFDEVALCRPTTGAYDLILMVTGETFDDIDRVIEERIRPLDGVLRVKQDRIINLENL